MLTDSVIITKKFSKILKNKHMSCFRSTLKKFLSKIGQSLAKKQHWRILMTTPIFLIRFRIFSKSTVLWRVKRLKEIYQRLLGSLKGRNHHLIKNSEACSNYLPKNYSLPNKLNLPSSSKLLALLFAMFMNLSAWKVS